MTLELSYGTVLHRPRKVIHVIRVAEGVPLSTEEIEELALKMRDRLLAKQGEQSADVVVVQGGKKETLRLSGDSYAVSRVRAAMFNAEIRWKSIEID